MWLLWLLSIAAAAPAPSGIQIRALPGAVEFTERLLEDLDSELYEDDVGAEVSCWDRVGVTPLQLTVPVDTVDLRLQPGSLGVTVQMGTIAGDDMRIYGEDTETLDTCPEFEAELRQVRLYDGQIEAALSVGTVSGWLGEPIVALDWEEPPVITGDLQTDIAWFPDAVVLWFVEDAIFAAASDTVADLVPPMATELIAGAVYGDDWDGLGVHAELASLRIDAESLTATVDVDVSVTETVACEVGETGGAPSPGGRAPDLPLDRGGDRDLAVGITEQMLAHALHASWERGDLCVQPEGLAELLADLRPLVDDDVAALEGWTTLLAPPVVTVDEGRMEVALDGLQLVITGRTGGATVDVARVTLDVAGELVPGFDPQLTAVTGSLRDLRITFVDLKLDHVAGGGAVAKIVEDRVERWAAAWAEGALQGMVLLDALYHAYGVAMAVEAVEPRDGGLELYFRLYRSDDPAVDTEPPDTTVSVTRVRARSVELALGGVDDRDDALAWSRQVDGRGWSSFSLEDAVTLDHLEPGTHTIEVVARDRWLNVDPTPATVVVEVEGRGRPEGCGCAGDRASAPWPLLIALLGLRRRRRAPDHSTP